MNDVVIAGAARLPIGRFGRTLKDVRDWELGTIAIAEAVKRAGLRGNEIEEVIMAHGFRTGETLYFLSDRFWRSESSSYSMVRNIKSTRRKFRCSSPTNG
jgi:hypothetical protein